MVRVGLCPIGQRMRIGVQARRRLFGLFWPLTLAQPHSRATAILVDKINAPTLKCDLKLLCRLCTSPKRSVSRLQSLYRWYRYAGG
jgi:hypothetical protein